MSQVTSQLQFSPNETTAPFVSEWFSRAPTSIPTAPNREGDLRNNQPNRPEMDAFFRAEHRRA